MSILFRLSRRFVRRGDDAGIALVVVVLGMSAAMVFSLAGLAYATSTMKVSRHDQDWNGALTAAEAGIDDYIAHLNRNDAYARSWDCSNVAMQGQDEPASNTCGWGASTPLGWLPVNPGQPSGPMFHYNVVSSMLDSNGTIQVTSTGKVNGVSRTLQAAVGRGGSTDYVYYTDHEDADPDNTVMYPPSQYPSGAPSQCSEYWWQGRSSYSSYSQPCQEITFIGGDVLDGKVHTNDTPLFTNNGTVKPEFKQGVETPDPACKNAVIGNLASYKYCDRTQNNANYDTSYPSFASILKLADNSSQFTNFPGCKYFGSTRIKLLSNGTMQVWSAASTGADAATAACGGDAPNGVVVTVPTNQTVYVQDAATQSQCLSGQIGDGLPLGTYTGAAATSSNYGATYTYDTTMTKVDQYCGQGNLYLEGTLSGQLTLAAENDIVVTGDITLAGGLNGADLLGLVAGNSVEVMHPLIDTWKNVATCTRSSRWGCQSYSYSWQEQNSPYETSAWPHKANSAQLEIDGSIQTLQHSFYVQNYDQGGHQGNLVVKGSIAQEWRGAVGRGTAGYYKAYSYDTRLKYSSPPYFPSWTNAIWSIRHLGQL